MFVWNFIRVRQISICIFSTWKWKVNLHSKKKKKKKKKKKMTVSFFFLLALLHLLRLIKWICRFYLTVWLKEKPIWRLIEWNKIIFRHTTFSIQPKWTLSVEMRSCIDPLFWHWLKYIKKIGKKETRKERMKQQYHHHHHHHHQKKQKRNEQEKKERKKEYELYDGDVDYSSHLLY